MLDGQCTLTRRQPVSSAKWMSPPIPSSTGRTPVTLMSNRMSRSRSKLDRVHGVLPGPAAAEGVLHRLIQCVQADGDSAQVVPANQSVLHQPPEPARSVSDHADGEAPAIGRGHQLREAGMQRGFAAQEGDLADAVPQAPSDHVGKGLSAHPLARAEEIGWQETISTPAVALRRNVHVYGLEAVLRWELDQAVKRGANQTLRHSATALPADQYVWQSDRKNKLRPPGTRESLPRLSAAVHTGDTHCASNNSASHP